MIDKKATVLDDFLKVTIGNQETHVEPDGKHDDVFRKLSALEIDQNILRRSEAPDTDFVPKHLNSRKLCERTAGGRSLEIRRASEAYADRTPTNARESRACFCEVLCEVGDDRL